jgi:hypothetical protein
MRILLDRHAISGLWFVRARRKTIGRISHGNRRGRSGIVGTSRDGGSDGRSGERRYSPAPGFGEEEQFVLPGMAGIKVPDFGLACANISASGGNSLVTLCTLCSTC